MSFNILARNGATIFLIATVLLVNKVHGQNGYIVKDSVYTQGEVSQQKSLYKNNRELIFTKRGKQATYTPDEIKEYGFLGGETYVTRKVPGGNKATNYFLLRLANGERALYQLREKRKSRFFIEHGKLLIELKRGRLLHDQLSTLLNPCISSSYKAKYTHFSKTSLKRAVLLTNSCFPGFFPRLRMGAFVGVAWSSISLTSIASSVSVTSQTSSPMIGVFVEVPLGISRSLSMDIQTTFQQNNFSGSQTSNSDRLDYQLSSYAIGFPVCIKYRGTSQSLRPFIATGLAPTIYSPQVNAVLTSTTVGSKVFLSNSTWDSITTFHLNAILSSGLEYSLNRGQAVSLELRANKQMDNQSASHSFAVIGSYYF
jgi:hypothetical protein